MGLWCDWGWQDRIVCHQDDVKAVRVESAAGNCTAIGNGRDVLKILFEGQGFPAKCVLNGFCINASGMQADTSANAA